MNKLLVPLTLLAVIGSSHALASNVDDGFNWPSGLSSVSSERQMVETIVADGFDWPEGFSSSRVEENSDVAYGFNWPEGY